MISISHLDVVCSIRDTAQDILADATTDALRVVMKQIINSCFSLF